MASLKLEGIQDANSPSLRFYVLGDLEDLFVYPALFGSSFSRMMINYKQTY
jgi:hypothetical protein